MTRQIAFADTVFEGFLSMEPVAKPYAAARRMKVIASTGTSTMALAQRQAVATAAPRPTLRAAAIQLPPPAARRQLQPAPGTALLVSLITLVLMPAACLSMVFVLQSARF